MRKTPKLELLSSWWWIARSIHGWHDREEQFTRPSKDDRDDSKPLSPRRPRTRSNLPQHNLKRSILHSKPWSSQRRSARCKYRCRRGVGGLTGRNGDLLRANTWEASWGDGPGHVKSVSLPWCFLAWKSEGDLLVEGSGQVEWEYL